MVCWISARRSLQVVGCWVNIQKKIQVKPMITWTNFGKLFPLSVCPPVISRRIHLLWKNVHQHHTMLEIHIVVFVCWKSQKHHGFCLGGKWDPYRFPGISWGESKGQKDDLKAETGPVRILLGVTSSKSFKRKPIGSIGACWFQRFVLKKIFTQQKKMKKTCVSPIFWQLSFGVNISPKLCVFVVRNRNSAFVRLRKIVSWPIERSSLEMLKMKN